MAITQPLVTVYRDGTPIGKIQFDAVCIHRPDGSCVIPQPPDRKTSWACKPFPGFTEQDFTPAVQPILQALERADTRARGEAGNFQWEVEV